MSNIQFFSEVDMNKKGQPSSGYPAWYFDPQIDELKVSIQQREHALEGDLVPKSEVGIQKTRLEEEKKRLHDILGGVPKLSAAEKDELAKAHKSIGTKIAEGLFTYSDMERGTADAHEEARRMSEPCIKLHDNEMDLAMACGVKPYESMVSRTQAERMWKISSKYLGENVNVETLRKMK